MLSALFDLKVLKHQLHLASDGRRCMATIWNCLELDLLVSIPLSSIITHAKGFLCLKARVLWAQWP